MPVSRIANAGITASPESVTVADKVVSVLESTAGTAFDLQVTNLESVGNLIQVGIRHFDPAKTAESARSTTAFHSTLFEAFGLRAEAVYNFYTNDETSNPDQDENVPAHQLPRYIELFWNPVPNRTAAVQGGKSIRPLDERRRTVAPVLGVREAIDSSANTFISPGVLNALLVNPVSLTPAANFSEDSFLTSEQVGGLSAASYATDPASQFHTSAPVPVVHTRVSFIDPSIAGAADQNRMLVAGDEIQLINAGAISKLLSSLEVLSEFNQDVRPQNPPPVFPAPADSPTLTYIGYLIERFELGPNGDMTPSKTFEVGDINQRRFVDRSVLFGVRYAYRIRTVVQWTHEPGITFTGPSTIIRQDPFDPAAGTPRKEASFYAGDWSDWARAQVVDNVLPDPPDELTVRPISHRGEIDVVWKMPNDPQKDIHRVRLLRCVDNGKLGPWKLLGEFPALNGRYTDRDVRPFEESREKYIYAMYSLSLHGERSALSEQIEARLAVPSRRITEFPLKRVAPGGYDAMSDSYVSRLLVRDWTIIAKSRIGFYIRRGESVHPLHDRTYVVEVQSLSTGERVQLKLAVDSTDVEVGTSTRGRRA
jgi:hypothetical protein